MMRLYGILLFKYTDALEKNDQAAIATIREMARYDKELAKLLSLLDHTFSRETGQKQKDFVDSFFAINPVSPLP